MKKVLIKLLILILVTLNYSCDGDPSGKLFWVIYGFPMLGISYVAGIAVMNLFSSNKKNNENNAVISIIVGIIILSIIYSIFKAILK
nr:hypothetical protein [uncultured Flavobacterium sp.]